MKTTLSSMAILVAATFALPAQAAYQEITVSDGGTISGTVSFTGKDPAPQIYAVTKDNDVCGTGDRKIDFVNVKNGALMDVVVYLKKVKKGKKFVQKSLKINQKGCEFLPFTSIMTNNQNFSALNSDPVLHNIHTYEIMGRAKKTVMNISQPDQGSNVKEKVKLRRGISMKVECDAHDFMHSFVFVAKNPYYARVDENGRYTIDHVPAGKYKISAWHGTLKNQKSKTTVTAGGTTTVNFTFKGK